MSETFIRNLPENVEKAVIGYTENRNGVDSFTFVCFDEDTGSLVSVGGELNVIYEGEIVNRVHSVYDISHPEFFLQKDGKEIVVTDIKKAKDILEEARIQYPALQNILDYARIVAQSGAESQEQNSAVLPAPALDTDEAYLAVAEKYRDGTATEAETEQLRQAVEQAAKKAGYTRRLFHGAKSGGGFTVLKGWQYFTENEA